MFYLQNATIIPTRRYPFNTNFEITADVGSEVLQRILPVYGRKQANFTVVNTSANDIAVRIGMIAPPGITGGTMYERTLATFTGITTNSVQSFTFGSDMTNATYLTLYVTATGPAAGTGYATIELTDVPGGGCTCEVSPPT